MTEHDLTALAKDYLIAPKSAGGALAEGYLALLAERDAFKAQLDDDKVILAEERQINADNRRQIRGLQAQLADIRSPGAVLQAVLDAINGTLDPSTPIADHPNVKFAQMRVLAFVTEIETLRVALTMLHMRPND